MARYRSVPQEPQTKNNDFRVTTDLPVEYYFVKEYSFEIMLKTFLFIRYGFKSEII